MFFGVLFIAFVVAFVWGLRTLAELRRGQAELRAEIARLGNALGVLPRSTPVIVCEKCGAVYDADLSGCTVCGRAKSEDAIPVIR